MQRIKQGPYDTVHVRGKDHLGKTTHSHDCIGRITPVHELGTITSMTVSV